MLTPLDGQLSPLTQQRQSSAVVYLFRDEFITNEAAPIITPRTSEPGPGTLTVVADTENQISVTSNKLTFGVPSINSWTLQQTASSVVTRAVGVISFVTFSVSTANYFVPLWLCSIASSLQPGDTRNKHGVYVYSGTRGLYLWISGFQINTGYTLALNTEYTCALLLRASGAFYFVKGGTFVDWTLLYVSTLDSTAALFMRANNYRSAFTLDNLSARQLPAPFDNEVSWRTFQLLNPPTGTTATHGTNFVFDIKYTYSADLLLLDFRIQDTTHYWQLYISSSGIYLRERNGGGLVNRATYAWPSVPNVGDTVWVVLMADGNRYCGYVYLPSFGAKFCWTYTDVSNLFLTATQFKATSISGGIPELNAWPSRPELPI